MTNAEEFLKQKQLFQLGDLPTETPNPKTAGLSQLAQNDLAQGLRVLRQVDMEALQKILARFEESRPLFKAVAETFAAGNRVFLVGCGATGRLSLSLEYLWRQAHPGSDQVISLMAGGDVALVHSLEGFEDFPEYGARHLRQLGFNRNDLLIGITEGGETPYVIGAVEEAAVSSSRSPFFLFCNSPDVLIKKVERSRRVLQNPKIHSIYLETGPMALTGSTRMQASTVQMLVAGLALFHAHDFEGARAELESWIDFLGSQDFTRLQNYIVREAETYEEGDYTIYCVDDLAITVFTDTTERAPTFNLAPFDNPSRPSDKHSLTYIAMPATGNAAEAWRALLGHDPRPLNWPDIHPKTTSEYLLSFDFSLKALKFRESLDPKRRHHSFEVKSGPNLNFRFRGIDESFALSGQNSLFDHLTAKMLLNMHSTLVMGRLGRYESNLMTWVYPSNGKLIDRAARYTQILLKQKGITNIAYDDIVRAQFACKTNLTPKESIIHKTIAKLTGKWALGKASFLL